MNVLKPEIARKMEESWKLRDRAFELLEIIASEFETDPQSVQCFDIRIVKETIETTKRLKKLKRELGRNW